MPEALFNRDYARDVDHTSPALNRAKVGTTMAAMITAYNLLAAKYDAFVVKYNALLAHLDTANVTGVGNANAATYAAVASGVNVGALGTR